MFKKGAQAIGVTILAGDILDAVGIARKFAVSDGGQTLAFAPLTDLIGGNVLTAASWSNGLSSTTVEGTIAVDGSNSATVFGFGGDAIVNQTEGTITAGDGSNFIQGDTWNISGGSIIARYILANGGNGGTIIKISGGRMELADC